MTIAYDRSPRRRRASWMSLAVEMMGEIRTMRQGGGEQSKERTLDGDTLGVDGGKVGVLKERDKISLGGLLKSHDGRRLEAQIRLEVLCDLTDETLEAAGEVSSAEVYLY
jgi:hypothetical protein